MFIRYSCLFTWNFMIEISEAIFNIDKRGSVFVYCAEDNTNKLSGAYKHPTFIIYYGLLNHTSKIEETENLETFLFFSYHIINFHLHIYKNLIISRESIGQPCENINRLVYDLRIFIDYYVNIYNFLNMKCKQLKSIYNKRDIKKSKSRANTIQSIKKNTEISDLSMKNIEADIIPHYIYNPNTRESNENIINKKCIVGMEKYVPIFEVCNIRNLGQKTSFNIEQIETFANELDNNWLNQTRKCVYKIMNILRYISTTYTPVKIFILNNEIKQFVSEPNITNSEIQYNIKGHLSDIYRVIYFIFMMKNNLIACGDNSQIYRYQIDSICDLIRIYKLNVEPLRRIHTQVDMRNSGDVYFPEYEKLFDVVNIFSYRGSNLLFTSNIFKHIAEHNNSNVNECTNKIHEVIELKKPLQKLSKIIIDILNSNIQSIYSKCDSFKEIQNSKEMTVKYRSNIFTLKFNHLIGYLFTLIENDYDGGNPVDFITSNKYKTTIIKLSELTNIFLIKKIFDYLRTRIFCKIRELMEYIEVNIDKELKYCIPNNKLDLIENEGRIKAVFCKYQAMLYLYEDKLDFLLREQRDLLSK